MGELTDAYQAAQAFKNEAASDWSPTGEQLRTIFEQLAGELGEVTPQMVEQTLRGLGWVARLVVEHQLELDELMAVCQALDDGTRQEVVAAGLTDPGQACSAGTGAGFFTGLLVGLIVAERRRA